MLLGWDDSLTFRQHLLGKISVIGKFVNSFLAFIDVSGQYCRIKNIYIYIYIYIWHILLSFMVLRDKIHIKIKKIQTKIKYKIDLCLK